MAFFIGKICWKFTWFVIMFLVEVQICQPENEETAEKPEEKPAETVEIADISELNVEIKYEIAQEVEAERALDVAIEAAETTEAADVA